MEKVSYFVRTSHKSFSTFADYFLIAYIKNNTASIQVLSGSNKCGRIEHHPFDGQFVGEKSRVDVIREKCPHMYMEMNPGRYYVYLYLD